MPSLSTDQLDKLTCHAQQASNIIYPLQEVGITGVFYERIYRNGSVINIANDQNWTQLYFDKIISGGYTEKRVSEYCYAKPGFSLSALSPKNKLWLDGQYFFGHGNGIILIEDHNCFREVIGFYSTNNNTAINDFYINNLSTIREIKQYFLIKSSSLIQDLEQEKLIDFYKAYDKQQNPHDIQQLKYFLSKKEASFKNNTLIQNKKTHLPMYLSPQRSKCLTLLSEGKSHKEIATLMSLSIRTVEHYIAKLRHDLGCRTSKELIAVYGAQLSNT